LIAQDVGERGSLMGIATPDWAHGVTAPPDERQSLTYPDERRDVLFSLFLIPNYFQSLQPRVAVPGSRGYSSQLACHPSRNRNPSEALDRESDTLVQHDL